MELGEIGLDIASTYKGPCHPGQADGTFSPLGQVLPLATAVQGW